MLGQPAGTQPRRRTVWTGDAALGGAPSRPTLAGLLSAVSGCRWSTDIAAQCEPCVAEPDTAIQNGDGALAVDETAGETAPTSATARRARKTARTRAQLGNIIGRPAVVGGEAAPGEAELGSTAAPSRRATPGSGQGERDTSQPGALPGAAVHQSSSSSAAGAPGGPAQPGRLWPVACGRWAKTWCEARVRMNEREKERG